MKAPHNRITREKRADLFFALYDQMGSGRSLEALAAVAINYGLGVSITTLRRYSVDFHWQEQLAARDGERQGVDESPAGIVARMNEKQALLGAAAQELARKAFEAIAGQVDSIGPVEAIRLAKDGQHIERLARGEATSRQEITIAVYNELVAAIVVLFDDSTKILPVDLREAVRRPFALGADRLISAHIEGAPLDARVVSDEEPTNQG